MLNFFYRNKKTISYVVLICSISLLGIFIMKVNSANAVFGMDIDPGSWVLKAAISLMVFMIEFIGKCLNLAVVILSEILNWGNFIEAPIVKIGWIITRDLANMFFVLVLLMIAFGLILRKETYGSKTLLTNLIIAALLINFSLVIAGVIIDSSQVLTDFFITQSGGQDLLESNLMNATQSVKALTTRKGVTLGVGIEALANVGMGAFLTLIFLLSIFFVFAAYAFFLIVRIVALWVLLIFAPLVWLLWTLPATKQYWDMWWKNFIKWCFFAPISAFFIYLSIFSYKSLLTANMITALETKDKAQFLPQLTSLPNLVAFGIIIALLFQGLKVAQLAGDWGAKGVIDLAKGGKNKVVNWSKRTMKEKGARPLSQLTGGIGKRLAKRGVISQQLARPFRAASEKTSAADRAAIERYEKKYKGYTNENLKSEFKSIIASPQAKAAIAKILSDRNELEEDFEKDGVTPVKSGFTSDDKRQALEVAKKYNMHKDMLNSDLKMSKELGEDPYEVIERIKTKDAEKISLSGITDRITKEIVPDVKEALTKHLTERGGSLNKNFLSELNKNNFSVFEKIQNEIIKKEIMPKEKWEKVEKQRPDITSYINSNAGKALFHEIIGKLDWIEEEKKKKKKEGKPKKEEGSKKAKASA